MSQTRNGKDMFRGSTILRSNEGPRCFLTDCFEDEMDIIELGSGPAISMINENDFNEAHTLMVINDRCFRAQNRGAE